MSESTTLLTWPQPLFKIPLIEVHDGDGSGGLAELDSRLRLIVEPLNVSLFIFLKWAIPLFESFL